MPFKTTCPEGHPMMILDEYAGRRVKCPTCGAAMLAMPSDAQPASVHSHAEPRPPMEAFPVEEEVVYRPRQVGRRARRVERDVEPHRGGTIMVLGILSIFVAPLILGPIAWAMGSADLEKMRQGRMDRRGEKDTNTGRLCGKIMTLIASGFVLLMILVMVTMFVIGFVAEGQSRRASTPIAPHVGTQNSQGSRVSESPSAKPVDPPRRQIGPNAPPPVPPAPAVPPRAKPADSLPPRKAGLIAHWSFDGDEGDVVKDHSGNGLDAKLVGCQRGEGVRGKGVVMTGENQYVDLGTRPMLNFREREPFTIALWFKTPVRLNTILSFRNQQAGSPIISLNWRLAHLEAIVRSDGDEFREVRLHTLGRATALREENLWRHAAVTRNESGEIALYEDGVLSGNRRAGNTLGAITTDLRALGNERYGKLKGHGLGNDFIGSIDEVRVYTGELSGDEIKQLAAKSDTPPQAANDAGAKPSAPTASKPPAPAGNAPDGWQELVTPDKRVRALVPKAIGTHSSTVNATVNGVKLRLDLTIADAGSRAFGAALATIPESERRRPPEVQLNLMRDGMLQRVSARLVSEKRITFGEKKYPGRELVADFVHEGTPGRLYCRTFLIGEYGVCLLATVESNALVGNEIERFYKSFEWNADGKN